MDFRKEAANYFDTPWPTRDILRPGDGFAVEGRHWPRIAIGDIPCLVGHIIADMHELAEYVDVLLEPYNLYAEVLRFNITLRRFNRGLIRPDNLPGPLLEKYLRHFVSSSVADLAGPVPLRLAFHREGLFWEWPVDFDNGDEGFLERYINGEPL